MTGDGLRMSLDAFFWDKSHPPRFLRLLSDCLRHRASLRFAIGQDAVTITMGPGEGTPGCAMQGDWITPGIHADRPLPTGARLLLPTLFLAQEMVVSHDCLCPPDLQERSMATFWAQSLFAALLVERPVQWLQTGPDPANVPVSQIVRKFYFWALRGKTSQRTFFNDTITEDALDTIIIDSYINVAKHDSTMLALGAEALRQQRDRAHSADAQDLALKVIAARNRLIDILAG